MDHPAQLGLDELMGYLAKGLDSLKRFNFHEFQQYAINTVAVSLEDGSIVFAVAGASEEKKLISMQKCIEEEKAIVSLMQIRDEIAAA